MNWYNIKFDWLFGDSLPTIKRGKKTLALFKAFAAPLQKIADETLYKMQHNGQVIYLEKVLNEWFSVAGYDTQDHDGTKTVFISDAPPVPRNYVYLNAEDNPLYLGTVSLGNPMAVNYKFIVNVPSSYTFVEAKLRAVIDYYRLAGKKYIIVTYDL